MSQVAKSASALERAFLAMLELEAMQVQLFSAAQTRRGSWRTLDSSREYQN
jgi:hypothetical protein